MNARSRCRTARSDVSRPDSEVDDSIRSLHLFTVPTATRVPALHMLQTITLAFVWIARDVELQGWQARPGIANAVAAVAYVLRACLAGQLALSEVECVVSPLCATSQRAGQFT